MVTLTKEGRPVSPPPANGSRPAEPTTFCLVRSEPPSRGRKPEDVAPKILPLLAELREAEDGEWHQIEPRFPANSGAWGVKKKLLASADFPAEEFEFRAGKLTKGSALWVRWTGGAS